ncbi:MAG: hypothetical protein A3J54_03055 [Candidatus Ryanbacteria bacterium RIFCSPHIGHO2_02_FULL_45_13b]|uniref:JAB domain-containing protein n=1 Tax=Candidatus Ryanbacteria bacterium RIFCSPHIGHO2_02_FULL_45_13b TaxID=1802117 RepID=A0A1G2G6T2_9BACT|nr:MAG: hypothetical protein A3J54_03055 [Candidatus Ryanbacteria bacterium RIFCSPHIGHO2_02_FULL_45_13b]
MIYNPEAHGSPALITGVDAIVSPPTLFVGHETYRELCFYFSSMEIEFQVMGFVKKDEGNMFSLSDLVIPPHSAGSIHTEIDQDKFPGWLDELEKAGKDIQDLRFQGHSHGMLSAFFSPEDIDTIRNAYGCDWMVSLVGNKTCDFKVRLDVFQPIPISLRIPLMVGQQTVSEEEAASWSQKLHTGHKATEKKFLWRKFT